MNRALAAALPIFALGALAACATGARGSSRRICFDAGFQPGTEAFTDCWHRIRAQQFAIDGSILLGILGAVTAAQPARPNPLLNERPAEPRRCVYWTPQGTRTVLAVNGVCPLRYGE